MGSFSGATKSRMLEIKKEMKVAKAKKTNTRTAARSVKRIARVQKQTASKVATATAKGRPNRASNLAERGAKKVARLAQRSVRKVASSQGQGRTRKR